MSFDIIVYTIIIELILLSANGLMLPYTTARLRRDSIKRTTGLSDERIDEIESDLTGTFGEELGGILAKGVESGSVKIGM